MRVLIHGVPTAGKTAAVKSLRSSQTDFSVCDTDVLLEEALSLYDISWPRYHQLDHSGAEYYSLLYYIQAQLPKYDVCFTNFTCFGWTLSYTRPAKDIAMLMAARGDDVQQHASWLDPTSEAIIATKDAWTPTPAIPFLEPLGEQIVLDPDRFIFQSLLGDIIGQSRLRQVWRVRT